MNENRTKEIIKDIIEFWNKKDFESRKYAKSKLKMSKWFIPVKTYNFLAEKMGVELLPDFSKDETKTEKIESLDVLKEAQKLFGGKIIDDKKNED